MGSEIPLVTRKTLGWGDVQELPPAFCIFYFCSSAAVYSGVRGLPSPFPEHRGRETEKMGASSPPTPSCLLGLLSPSFQGLCIV